jgi:hypothetical protein
MTSRLVSVAKTVGKYDLLGALTRKMLLATSRMIIRNPDIILHSTHCEGAIKVRARLPVSPR